MSATQAKATDYSVLVVAVDDLEWTKHWLGRLRCDELLVSVARREDVSPQLKIRAVESKSSSAYDPIDPRPEVEPFAEGLGQVVATLESLNSLVNPPGPDPLVEDLRFATFVEHLAALALAEFHPIQAADTEALHATSVISQFSLRQLAATQIALDGAVVCTQYRANVGASVVNVTVTGSTCDWTVLLCRVGSAELNAIVGTDLAFVLGELDKTVKGFSAGTSDPKDTEPSEYVSADEALANNRLGAQELQDLIDRGSVRTDPDTGFVSRADLETYYRDREKSQSVSDAAAADSVQPSQSATSRSSSEKAATIARDLFIACSHRAFPVEEPDPRAIVVGPSLLAIPMSMRPGGSIRPIEAALDDLAREVGVPSVSVENDPERPFFVRFLVARKDREFPALPPVAAALQDEASQSYLGTFLGRTLQGSDFSSFLSAWPHMLVGGSTGSGKTTFIRSLLYQWSRIPEGCVHLAIIDGKGEIDYINVVPPSHFTPRFPDVLLGHQHALDVFKWVVEEEIPKRRAKLLDLAKESQGRPKTAREMFVSGLIASTTPPISPLIVVVDEFAEIMLAGGANAQTFEDRVQQVTQVGRSVLVHLVLATQRPDATVVRGAIKANLDARVALRLPTFHDSMTILGGKGAERLLGRGDLVFQTAGQPTVRLQGYSA